MDYQVGYVWSDGKIITQSLGLIVRGTSGGNPTETQINIDSKYVYEEGSNTPYAAMFMNSEYLLVKNAQGDVTAVVDSRNGETLVEYEYDPWGQVTSTYCGPDDDEITKNLIMTIVNAVCPLTYRGYNYDFTTGLYYLQSRYYNPEWGRFLNVDDVKILASSAGDPLAANPYLYCSNNPVNRVDYTGYECEELIEGLMQIFTVFLLCYYCDPLFVSDNDELFDMTFQKNEYNLFVANLVLKKGKKYASMKLVYGEPNDWFYFSRNNENLGLSDEEMNQLEKDMHFNYDWDFINNTKPAMEEIGAGGFGTFVANIAGHIVADIVYSSGKLSNNRRRKNLQKNTYFGNINVKAALMVAMQEDKTILTKKTANSRLNNFEIPEYKKVDVFKGIFI